MVSIADFNVGQEVVLCFSEGTPIHCNMLNKPATPTRVTISKIGRKRIYVHRSENKAQPVDISFEDNKYHVIVPIDQAKAAYRAKLQAREVEVAQRGYSILTQVQIDNFVNSL